MTKPTIKRESTRDKYDPAYLISKQIETLNQYAVYSFGYPLCKVI